MAAAQTITMKPTVSGKDALRSTTVEIIAPRSPLISNIQYPDIHGPHLPACLPARNRGFGHAAPGRLRLGRGARPKLRDLGRRPERKREARLLRESGGIDRACR